MAVPKTARAPLTQALLAALALLAAFWVATHHLTRESLWDDEAFTLWFIHDDGRAPDGISETIQYVRASLTNALARVRADVHPPLYFLALDVWSLLTGRSVFAIRLLSTIFAIIALAALYAVGRRLFDRQTALLAIVLLGTASFFVYYTREARMYTLLAALATLLIWACLRWQQRPTLWRGFVFGLLAAALLYTHYYGALLVLAIVLHWLIANFASGRPGLTQRIGMPMGWALLLYLPWLPVLSEQFRTQGGPTALPLATSWETAAALLLILTSGHWGLFAAPYVLGGRFDHLRRDANSLSLVLSWLLPTILLLALNAWRQPLFQIRYTFITLPAWALLAAYGFRMLAIGGLLSRLSAALNQPSNRIGLGAAAALFAWLVYSQLAIYSEFWPDKPRWEAAVRQAAETRDPLEPALTSVAPSSPAAYYAELYPLRGGLALDLAWRWQESADMERYAAHVAGAPRVWAMLPTSLATSWDAVAALAAGRGVAYRDTVMNLIFYRFDQGTDAPLRFQFGDSLGYDGGIGHQLYAVTGDPFCFQVDLTALKPLSARYRIDFQLTQGYNTVRASGSTALTDFPAGESQLLETCLDIPADTPNGPHHLRLSIFDHDLGDNLPLLEDGRLYWGIQLIMARVSVADP